MIEERPYNADPIDTASEKELAATEEGIKAVSLAAQQQQSPLPDGTYPFPDCEMCDQEIGEARLKVAPRNKLCVFCATLLERKRR